MARPVPYRAAFAEARKSDGFLKTVNQMNQVKQGESKMATEKVRVKTGFGALNDPAAVSLSGNVAVGLPLTFDLKTLVPPVDPANLKQAHDDLVAAIEAADQGGPVQTADKKKKRKVVNGMLDKLAPFVQLHCNNDVKTDLSAGFAVVTHSTAQSALTVSNIISVDNGKGGELVIRARSVRNAFSYEVRGATVGANATIGEFKFLGSFTTARAMTVTGLVPGTTYAFSVRAVGSYNRYSDWSD